MCRNDEERGLVRVLDLTGMHVSSLRNAQLVKRGAKTYVQWIRPKTKKTLESPPVPSQSLPDIEAFFKVKRHSRQAYYDDAKEIAAKAGYESVSPMTFRHNRCVRLAKQGVPLTEIAQIMGCSEAIIIRNYSKLREDQLYQEGEDEFRRLSA